MKGKTYKENIFVRESSNSVDGVSISLQSYSETSLDYSSGVFAFISFGERHIRSIKKKDKTIWMFYSTLKYIFSDKEKITQEDLKRVCGKRLPYQYDTARKFMTRLVEENYAFKCKDGYLLRGIKKVAREKFDVPARYRYMYIIGETKKECILRVYYCVFRSNVKHQHYEYSERQIGKSDSNKAKVNAYKSGRYSVSVRWVAKLANSLSATIGSMIEKEWEKMGLVKIKRSNQIACSYDQLKNYLLCYPEDKNKIFLSGGVVYKRLLNSIVCEL